LAQTPNQTVELVDENCMNCDDLQIEYTKIDPACDTATGVIGLTVTGGSGNYLYSINDGDVFQNTSTFLDLSAGDYTIKVRDVNFDCEKNVLETINLSPIDCPSCDSISLQSFLTFPTCDSLNGRIELALNGGSGDYAVSINGEAFQTDLFIDNLGAGTYTVLVRDNEINCEKLFTSIILLTTPTNCPTCDSLTIESSLFAPTCDTLNGEIALTVNGGSGDYEISVNEGVFQSNLTLDSLGEGMYTVIVRDNGMACEKTFAPISLITTEDCSCALGLFTETNFAVEAPTCESMASLCLDVSLTSLMKLEVLDNGATYSGGLAGCAFDTMLTYLYFTLPGQGLAGPYRLDRWELNGDIHTGEFQDIHELVAMMNTLDPAANWERDSASMTLKGGFPGNTYGALEITQLATDMMGVLQLNTNFLPRNSRIFLDAGMHQLVFKDPVNNCSDTLSVEVTCSLCPEITTTASPSLTIPDCGEQAKICFAGIDSLDLDGFVITDNGTNYAGTIKNCPDLEMGIELLLDTGQHQLIFENNTIDCQYIFDFTITCQTDTIRIDTTIILGASDTICFPDYLMTTDIVTIQPTCEGQSPNVGFEVNNLNNCLVYEGLVVGMDTLCLAVCESNNTCKEVIITVTVLDSMMMDTLCESIFIEKNAMVEIMDCAANGEYCLNLLKSDLVNYDLYINDSLFSEVYPDCDVPEQAKLELPVGNYQLILVEKEGVCSDTASLTIICDEEVDTFEDTILVNETDTFCWQGLDLMGPIVSIVNDCEDVSGEIVIFEVDTVNHCLYYTGVEPGMEIACVVICDSLDNCDTTIVTITVEPLPDTIPPPIAIDDVDTVTEGSTKTVNVLGNDTTNSTLITVVILDQPTNGTATVNPDLTISYMANDGLCDTTDMFTYELCNPSGCDTATVTFYIDCKSFLIFNGFSPNADGVNETFTIDGIEDFPNNNVQIFNRWGNMVFEQQGYKGQWDGTWKDKDLPDGTYFYLLSDGEGKQYSGFLEIRR